MPYLVTKELLDLRDQYDGDLGLLDEPWATKKDRERFSREQIGTLGEYLRQVGLRKVDCLSSELRSQVDRRIAELEVLIEPEALAFLRAEG